MCEKNVLKTPIILRFLTPWKKTRVLTVAYCVIAPGSN